MIFGVHVVAKSLRSKSFEHVAAGKAHLSGDEKVTEVIYKMVSLLKLGGLRTRGMIVDYRWKLSSSPANMERARQACVSVASGAQLCRLAERIESLVLRAE